MGSSIIGYSMNYPPSVLVALLDCKRYGMCRGKEDSVFNNAVKCIRSNKAENAGEWIAEFRITGVRFEASRIG